MASACSSMDAQGAPDHYHSSNKNRLEMIPHGWNARFWAEIRLNADTLPIFFNTTYRYFRFGTLGVPILWDQRLSYLFRDNIVAYKHGHFLVNRFLWIAGAVPHSVKMVFSALTLEALTRMPACAAAGYAVTLHQNCHPRPIKLEGIFNLVDIETSLKRRRSHVWKSSPAIEYGIVCIDKTGCER